jgi:hypothetical protein
VKFVYKPLGILISVLGGLLATQLFNRLWRVLPTDGEKAPNAKDRSASVKDIAIAATAQGAVFGVVKALVNRVGAKGFEKATGTWPA